MTHLAPSRCSSSSELAQWSSPAPSPASASPLRRLPARCRRSRLPMSGGHQQVDGVRAGRGRAPSPATSGPGAPLHPRALRPLRRLGAKPAEGGEHHSSSRRATRAPGRGPPLAPRSAAGRCSPQPPRRPDAPSAGGRGRMCFPLGPRRTQSPRVSPDIETAGGSTLRAPRAQRSAAAFVVSTWSLEPYGLRGGPVGLPADEEAPALRRRGSPHGGPAYGLRGAPPGTPRAVEFPAPAS